MAELVVIQHGESRSSRRLRRSRLRIALAVAALEGILVLAGAIPWWAVLVLAAGGLAVHAAVGREHANATVRSVTWIVAVSQLLVVLVPVATAILVALAVVVLVLFVVAALAALLLDRR